jgi:putative endonuclease
VTRTMKRPCVYILASKPYGTLYVGVTSDIAQRMAQHQQGLIEGFTKKYSIKTLVYYEMHDVMDTAIAREKRLKRWRREWKYRIIEQMNPTWVNLFDVQTGAIAFGSADQPNDEVDPHGDMDRSPPARG